ncbi:MAG: hypothetical protein KKB20_13890 [Proteobacteria bacterium]|nr:hypothetical protein [Pseudomonadota bacterium]
MWSAEKLKRGQKQPLTDRDLIEMSPFLADLVGRGVWQEPDFVSGADDGAFDPADDHMPSFHNFRREFKQIIHDPEAALVALRRLRVRTLLAVARADLEERIKPYQIRARLRSLAEIMVQGAWWVAEATLRERYVHPIILERRNINPPVAICSLSRLGAGDPWYTTGPVPVFVHSRAAEFAPALTEKDFTAARRTEKEWLPAREYFLRLASRTMSFLAAPDPAGKGYDQMAEDHGIPGPPLLPGALVVLFASFEKHFMNRRPLNQRLALIRLRFLVGQPRLGHAIEQAARTALLKTVADLGSRIKSGVNAWYRDRAKAEGMPMNRGSLLDIERCLRLLQFQYGLEDPDLLTPSPLKALDRMARAAIISGDERLILRRAYGWQWFVANRLSLLGSRADMDGDGLRSGRLDAMSGLAGAADRTVKHMRAAREVLARMARDTKKLP